MNLRTLFLTFVAALVLTACAFVSPQIAKSIYWRGKPAEDFFARYREPDVSLQCMKDNTFRRIYGYRARLYEFRDYEVGRDANTIYMQRDKVYTGHQWTVVFADEYDKITSVGSLEWGNLEKFYGCGEYAEKDTRFSAEDLAKRTSKPRQWRAYAMDDNPESSTTDIYTSQISVSEEEAKADALQKCQRAGKNKCVEWQWFSNMCLGTATGKKGGKDLTYPGISFEGEHADYTALQLCAKSGATQCKTFQKAACAVPCDMLKDKKCKFDAPKMGIYKTMPTQTVGIAE